MVMSWSKSRPHRRAGVELLAVAIADEAGQLDLVVRSRSVAS
jgi:hypothetical protein